MGLLHEAVHERRLAVMKVPQETNVSHQQRVVHQLGHVLSVVDRLRQLLKATKRSLQILYTPSLHLTCSTC